ncbi:MAG: hypothetical protein KDH96_11415, partial [Candidatus Riesia sp.]|nr:hypothetical protein [Candidatus Riesia sp.]
MDFISKNHQKQLVRYFKHKSDYGYFAPPHLYDENIVEYETNRNDSGIMIYKPPADSNIVMTILRNRNVNMKMLYGVDRTAAHTVETKTSILRLEIIILNTLIDKFRKSCDEVFKSVTEDIFKWNNEIDIKHKNKINLCKKRTSYSIRQLNGHNDLYTTGRVETVSCGDMVITQKNTYTCLSDFDFNIFINILKDNDYEKSKEFLYKKLGIFIQKSLFSNLRSDCLKFNDNNFDSMAEYIYGDGCIGKTKYIYNLCRIIGVNNIHIDNIVCIINNFANINFLVNKIRTDIKNGSSKTEPFLLLYDEFDKHVTSLINEYKWFITNYKQQCAMTGSDDDKDNMYIHSRSTKRQNTNVDLNDVNKGILNSINLFTSSLFILKFLGNQNIKEIINTSDIKHSYV